MIQPATPNVTLCSLADRTIGRLSRYPTMSDQDLIGELVVGRESASRWAVAAFVASCAFTGGALLLLILSWR